MNLNTVIALEQKPKTGLMAGSAFGVAMGYFMPNAVAYRWRKCLKV